MNHKILELLGNEQPIEAVPGGTVGKHLPGRQGHGFDSWPGKTPHTLEQMNSCGKTTEPML